MTNRQLYIISQERQKIVNNLGVCPSAVYRAVSAVARNVLLNGPYFYNGECFDIKAKSLGAGVYELFRVEV